MFPNDRKYLFGFGVTKRAAKFCDWIGRPTFLCQCPISGLPWATRVFLIAVRVFDTCFDFCLVRLGVTHSQLARKRKMAKRNLEADLDAVSAAVQVSFYNDFGFIFEFNGVDAGLK